VLKSADFRAGSRPARAMSSRARGALSICVISEFPDGRHLDLPSDLVKRTAAAAAAMPQNPPRKKIYRGGTTRNSGVETLARVRAPAPKPSPNPALRPWPFGSGVFFFWWGAGHAVWPMDKTDGDGSASTTSWPDCADRGDSRNFGSSLQYRAPLF